MKKNKKKEREQQKKKYLEKLPALSVATKIEKTTIFDSIIDYQNEHASNVIKNMANFYLKEFNYLYSICEPALESHMGRGRKPKIGSKDAFLLTLTMLKHYEKYDKMADSHHIKTDLLKSTIDRTIEIIFPSLVRRFIEQKRPKISYDEASGFFNPFYGFYCYLVESGHLPDGTLIFFGEPRKDRGILSEKYSDHFATLLDKGYTGADFYMRAIIPKKNSDNLTPLDTETNVKIGQDRVIIENWYGRQTNLWNIIGTKYRWNHSTLHKIFGITAALTNFHIEIAPLRHDEHHDYQSLLDTFKEAQKQKELKQYGYNKNARERQKKT